jgi:hypothetical protein
MALTLLDAESSYAMARVEWESFMREFIATWNRPLIETLLAMQFAGITPDEREAFPQVSAFESAFDQATGRKRGKYATRSTSSAPLGIPGYRGPAAHPAEDELQGLR